MDVGNFYCILMSKYLKILAGTTIYFSTTSKTVVKYRNSRISTDADWTTKLSISELTPKQEFWKDRCIYPAKKPVNRIDANLGKYIFYSLKIAVHKKTTVPFSSCICQLSGISKTVESKKAARLESSKRTANKLFAIHCFTNSRKLQRIAKEGSVV